MPVQIPRFQRRELRSFKTPGEVTAWSNDVDRTLEAVLRSLQSIGREVNVMTNLTSERSATRVGRHASSHLPAGTDALTTAAASTILPDDAAAIGTANSFARSDHKHAITTVAPAFTFAGTASEGSATSFVRSDAVVVFPQALRSIAATAGDALTLTSDGTNLTLTPSRAGADLIFVDQAGNKRLQLYDSTATSPGGFVNGHILVGQENHPFGTGPVNDFAVLISRRKSQASGFHSALAGNPIYDADGAGSDEAGAQYTVTLDTGYDPNVAGGTVNNFRGEFIDIGGTVGGAALVGSVVTLAGLAVRITPTIPVGSPAWTNMIGIQINNNSLGGVAPTRSYGIQVAGAGNGATAWAGMFGGDTQITASNKLRFGGLTVTQATDTLYRAAAGNLRWQIAGTDELDLNASALFPNANGGLGLGRDGNGFGDFWFKDSAAAFEIRVIATNTGITADRTLTVDVGDANRTLNLIPSAAYTPTNVTTDRSYDANATTVDELADVLGTVIADLQTKGILG